MTVQSVTYRSIHIIPSEKVVRRLKKEKNTEPQGPEGKLQKV